jgi:hypothetical protein
MFVQTILLPLIGGDADDAAASWLVEIGTSSLLPSYISMTYYHDKPLAYYVAPILTRAQHATLLEAC